MRPIGAPAPAMAAQIPTAFPLSSEGKTTTTTERVAGITSAAPIPITARAIITCSDVEAYIAVAPEVKATMTKPNCNAGLRPKRSPRAPITRSVPPNTSA